MVLGRTAVLVIGSGGREHAISKLLERSYYVQKVYHARGNGDTANNLLLGPFDFKNLAHFARNEDCITWVGPEDPLVKGEGIVNFFRREKLAIVGQTKEAAQLESSKVFGWEFAARQNIPVPITEVFDNPQKAKNYVKSRGECVVKLDGLHKGKGVEVCDSGEDAVRAIDSLMSKLKLRQEHQERILVQERLHGIEATYQIMVDGKSYKALPTSQDYKRVGNSDEGPNTGGMGAFSPTPIITPELDGIIKERIVEPTITGMACKGVPLAGFLYFGLMFVRENGTLKPYLLEYNVRLGDPEAQAVLSRLAPSCDIFPYLFATSGIEDEGLDTLPNFEVNSKSSVTVVMAAKGYPNKEGKYGIGELIGDVSDDSDPDTFVFHCGTRRNANNEVITNGGGRVLSVTALGKTLEDARDRAYIRVEAIDRKLRMAKGPQLHYRSDIAKSAIEMLRCMKKEQLAAH